MKMGANKKTARIAGLLYLLMGITGAFGMLYVPSQLISADAMTTASNITGNQMLLRLGIVSQLMCQILFVFMALVLYRLLQGVSRSHAVLMVVLVCVSVPIAFLNTLNQMAALQLLIGADYLKGFDTAQLHGLMMSFLKFHENGIFMVELFWGLWLFPFGYLVFKSRFIPKILGVLLIIGCFAYLVEAFTALLFPDLRESISTILMLPLSAGELGILLWLLIIGVREPVRKKQLV